MARRHDPAALCVLAHAPDLRRRRHREAVLGGHPDLHGSGAADRALSDAANRVAAEGRHRRAGGVLSGVAGEGARHRRVEGVADSADRRPIPS